ncbi:MAG: beta-propeller fold lactonase family protein, partial [Lachnospiraceae bacterium]|nr:beta-propeller fold lactonase family protein [Lachnospiraceae bacterium]
GWASGIIMAADGKYIVVSNRKHDSISSFRIDSETGKLFYCDNIKTGGMQPRFITWNEDRKSVLTANECSDTITEFTLDETSGRLSATGMTVETESPVCIIFR